MQKNSGILVPMKKKKLISHDTSTNLKKPHLVILGGGFGGIHTYKALPAWVKKNHVITIIDKHNHFLFTPLLPEVAGASLDYHSIVEPIRDLLDKDTYFIQSTVVSVDTRKQIIELSDKEISYDILVSALGSKTHYFGIPGAEKNSYILKTLDDAVNLRNHCVDLFEAASKLESSEERKKLLSFIIVGAGPTGVELTGELADLFFGTFRNQYPLIPQEDIKLMVINSGSDVLSMFDESLRSYAADSLVKDSIILKNNTRVAEVTVNGVVTSDNEIYNSETVIWTAGVTANSLPCTCGMFEVNRGRILIEKNLLAKGIDNVFVIGDLSLFPSQDGRGLPPTAQVAKQQGIHVAGNISRMLRGQNLKPFVYKEKGLLASIGSYNAIAEIHGFKFKGIFAWFMWRTIYLFNFASWKKRFKIMFDWTLNLFSGRDTTRL